MVVFLPIWSDAQNFEWIVHVKYIIESSKNIIAMKNSLKLDHRNAVLVVN